MSRVLVTPRSLTSGPLHPELARLEQAGHDLVLGPSGRVPTTDELHDLVPGCGAWLAGIEHVDRPTLEAASELQVIARHGVGVDSIDLAAAEDLGIDVVPSAGSNAEGVAELVVMLALLLRRPLASERAIDDHAAWQRTRGSELQHRRAAVIGFGAIGSRVAQLLDAFDMDVSVFDPFAPDTGGHRRATSLVEAVGGAELVTLHCPPSAEPIIGEAEIGSFGDDASLLNTARGSLVDLDAVLAALESGALGGYGCDAFSTEPPVPHPLWHHPRVIATPHIGGFTGESVQRSVASAVDTILRTLR